MHLPPLIRDLALILVVAGFASILFRFLRQPSVLGFLLAGVIVGPEITVFPSVVDVENIRTWADLGVIFLLVFLGLEFSFKKLFSVGRSAFLAALVEVLGMLAIGYGLGRIFGWNSVDSAFLGGILAISSTLIIMKSFEEMKLKHQPFASVVFGILVLEDLFAILILAFLSTFALTKQLSGGPLLMEAAKLGGFLAIVVPSGLFLVPKLFRWLHDKLTDETRVMLSLGLCLSLVLICGWVGFSSALGAFLAGAFMAETVEGVRIEKLLRPIKDLFGAIFFVSVGMLVDIRAMGEHWGLILIVTACTIVGKFLLVFGGMRLARQDRSLSAQAGLSLAQIGEFSFIIATLGLSLGVVRPELYPLAVAVSLLTTFTTPYFIRAAVKL